MSTQPESRDKGQPASPSTNREAVPDGEEGSIMEDAQTPRSTKNEDGADATELNGDRPQGNDRRIDDL